jgi:hypothetical protein
MTPWIYALIVHGVLGGLDIVINHEIIARLPKQPSLWLEVRLHSIRELIFATVFLGLAWFEWHGAWAVVLGLLFVGEVLVSTMDTVLELDVRQLPVTERIMHVLIFINLGVVMTLLVPDAGVWFDQPTALVRTHHGLLSYILFVQGVMALGWSIRDALAQHCLKRARRKAA